MEQDEIDSPGASQRQPMTAEQIRHVVGTAVEQARNNSDDEEVGETNSRVIDYFNGEMSDIEFEEGRSRAVSKDIADTITWLLPQLMRTFMSSDTVFEFAGQDEESDQQAGEVSDAINYLFLEECDGYQLIHDAVFDGLLLRNGVVKHWWDPTPEYDVQEHHSVTHEEAVVLVSADDVEVIGVDEVEPGVQQVQDPNTGEAVEIPVQLFDVKIKVKESSGKLCLECISPEQFFVEKGCEKLERARIMGDLDRKMRSDLVEMGFDQMLVDEIPAQHGDYNREEKDARSGDGTADPLAGEMFEGASEFVDYVEAFAQIDANGDGVAEWLRIIMGGYGAGAVLLHLEEWDQDETYTEFVPYPIPHRRLGRSIADDIIDLQRQKTVLKRALLDNIYMVNNPTVVYDQTNISADQAEGLTILDGTPVGVKGAVNQAVQWIQVPSVADRVLQAMEFIDQERETRTGMSRAAMGLSQDVLNTQTATAVNQATTASHTKIEQYARNIAENSMKRLGKAIYKLIVRNMDKPRTIRVKGKFLTIDPRTWPDEMDVTVNVGLGSGSRDRDVAALTTMGAYHQNVIQTYGPNNPIAGMRQVRAAGEKMAEVQGLKNADGLIGSEDDITRWEAEQQQMAEEQSQQPPPEVQKAQIDAQTKREQAQIDAQAKREQAQIDAQAKTAQLAQEAEMERAKMAQEAVLQREKVAQEAMLKREEIAADIDFKREQLREELEVKREAARMANQARASVPQVNIGGDPG